MKLSKEISETLIKEHVSTSYPIVDAYAGIREVSEELEEHGLLVVFQEGQFAGILTPHDILCRPHKLVIDCLSKKEQLNSSDKLEMALNRLNRAETVALPVYDGDRYQGIFRKDNLISILHRHTQELQKKVHATQGFKSEFLTNLAHEIRTPLNGILPFVEVLSSFEPEELAENSELIYSQLRISTDRFLEAMNDLIDLALIESGELIKLKIQKTDLSALFSGIHARLQDMDEIGNNALQIEDFMVDSSVRLHTDATKLERILGHLVTHAVRSCQASSVIRFGLDQVDKTKVGFSVEWTALKGGSQTDPLKALENKKTSSANTDSLGIGLSISQKLVGLLGGDIRVRRKPAGKTAVKFTISRRLED